MTLTRLLRIVRQRLRSLAAWQAQDAALDDELSFHLEQSIREKIAAGFTPDEARRLATREFGNVALVKDQSRDARRVGWLHDLLQDARYGCRMLRRSPGFSLVAIVSLGIGIGAATALTGALRFIFWQPLPFTDGDRLVVVHTVAPDGAARVQGVSVPEYEAWRQRSRTLEAIGMSLSSPREIGAEPDGPVGERLSSQAFTPNLFVMLGVRPAIGRLFAEASSPFSPAARVMVISHRLWQRRYGGRPDIIGRVVPTDGATRAIVGVMPPDFKFQDDDVEFWIPLIPGPIDRPDANIGRPQGATARLRLGVTAAEAQADLSSIVADLERSVPVRFRGRRVLVTPLRQAMYGWTRPLLLTLAGAVLLMLTIACANVAGLLLARGTTRRRELWVRLSLGAGRGRIVRQLLAESLLLAGGGAIVAVGVAFVSLRLLATSMGPPPGTPRVSPFPFDGAIVLVVMAFSVIVAAAVGALPAFAAVRRDGPAVTGGAAPPAGGDPRSTRTRGTLVAAELALATVLVITAGLLVNSYMRLIHRDLNFDPDGLASFKYVVERQDFARQVGFDGVVPVFELTPLPAEAIARVHARLRSVPGVEAVGGMTYQPVNSFIIPRLAVWPAGAADDRTSRDAPTIATFLVTPDLFRTMRTPIRRGREASDADGPTAPAVVVINEAAERLFFQGRSAIGQRLVVDWGSGSPAREVIGVVADVPTRRREPVAEPVVYIPSRQMPGSYRGGGANFFGQMTFVLRHSGDSTAVLDAARRAVAEVDPVRPIVELGVVNRALMARLPELANYVGAVGGFGVAALFLAAMGVYGVTAFAVAARTREVGIRRALGAGSREVVTIVGRRAATLVVAGLAVGVSAAVIVTRFIESQLIGVAPTDPATFAVATSVLGLVALVACVAPTRRALAVDPATVLRSE